MSKRALRFSRAQAAKLGIDLGGQAPAKRKNKFGAERQVIEGRTFDSTKEARRYQQLLLLEKTGELTGLRTQVDFPLLPKQSKPSGGIERPAKYTADFVYQTKDGKTVVEDTKSPPTRAKADYVLRRKLMLFVHGIEVIEV